MTDRLRQHARLRPGSQLADLQRQFAYDRLLCRVFLHDPDRWVLKGATAMLARLHGIARHTIDVDLYHSHGDLPEAEAALRRAAAVDLGDHFRFALGGSSLLTEAARAIRIPVVAYIGATEFAGFRVDLTADLRMTGVPEEVPPLVAVELPGMVQTRYRAYPVVDHIADKVSALFQRYAHDDGLARPSTRYRDLLDLVVFAHTASGVDCAALARALHSEFTRRGLSAPLKVAVPANADWRRGYARAARDAPTLDESDLDSALVTAARFIDPVLDGTATGTWDPDSLAWATGA